MKNLDQLASAAREESLSWDDARARRVLGSALERRDRRASRGRILRRAMVIGSAAAVVGLLFLRGANASTTEAVVDSAPNPSANALAVAADSLGDAGYARD